MNNAATGNILDLDLTLISSSKYLGPLNVGRGFTVCFFARSDLRDTCLSACRPIEEV